MKKVENMEDYIRYALCLFIGLWLFACWLDYAKENPGGYFTYFFPILGIVGSLFPKKNRLYKLGAWLLKKFTTANIALLKMLFVGCLFHILYIFAPLFIPNIFGNGKK